MRKSIIAALAIMTAMPMTAQKGYNALRFRQAEALYSYEMQPVHEQNLAREEEFKKACQSKVAMEDYISRARERFRAIAGPMPERGDLKAKTVGTVKGNGFNVEKVIFQSIPGRYVTAHLYMPADVKGRVPACIEMCGHGLRGKGDGSMLAERMAVNGIAVLVVDPWCQGERQQTIDTEGRNLTRGVTTEHTLVNPAFCLVGSSLTAQEFFDNSRAIDYLQQRKDIDGDRIGAYGFSGGGTQAAYLIGLDDRIKAGCVGLFFSSRERTLDLLGPSDGCQWIPGEGKAHIEIADMAMMMAPRPFIILDGKYDFVDHWGALRGYDELKRCYTVLGSPDKVAQYYAEDGHATPFDVQEQLVKWFRKWLSGEEGDIKPLSYWRGTGMDCTSKGQVNLSFSDARSSMQECLDRMDDLKTSRETFCKGNISDIRAGIMQLLGIDAFNDDIEAVSTGCDTLRDAVEYRYQINNPGQMPVPVIVRIPMRSTAEAPIAIHLHDSGKAWFLSEADRHDEVSDGTIIVAADLRGFGETADPWEKNLSKYWNRNWRCAVTALHAGRPLLGQRVADIRTVVDFCSSLPALAGHEITIVADGASAVAAMHSTVLDSRIHRASLTKTLKTWRSYIENPLQYDMMDNILVGVLKCYDIPDLVRLSQGRITITD